MLAQPAPSSAPRLTACESCDALMQLSVVPRATFHCPRCGAFVYRAGLNRQIDEALAFGLAAAFLFALANSFPIVSIDSGGDKSFASLPGAALALYQQGMVWVAAAVSLTTFVIPALELICTLWMLWFVKWERPFPWPFLFRLRKHLHPWSMIEIFMLGTLVAIVKLKSWAHVVLGPGLWSLGAFVILHAAAAHAFEAIEFWNQVDTDG